jgi:hypothetical protein
VPQSGQEACLSVISSKRMKTEQRGLEQYVRSGVSSSIFFCSYCSISSAVSYQSWMRERDLVTTGNSRRIKESNILLTSCIAARRGSSRLVAAQWETLVCHIPLQQLLRLRRTRYRTLRRRLISRKLKASQAIPRPSPQRSLSMAGWSLSNPLILQRALIFLFFSFLIRFCIG